MSDKPVAGILAALVAVPAVALCCGGTSIAAAALGGLTGWFSGFSATSALLIALVVAGVVLGVRQLRIRKPVPMADFEKGEP